MPVFPGLLEVVECGSKDRATSAADLKGQLMSETGLARRGEAVDCRQEPTVSQRKHTLGNLLDQHVTFGGGRRGTGLLPCRHRVVHHRALDPHDPNLST